MGTSKPTGNSHSNTLVAREKTMSHHNAVECIHIVIWKEKVIAMHNCMELKMVGNLNSVAMIYRYIDNIYITSL